MTDPIERAVKPPVIRSATQPRPAETQHSKGAQKQDSPAELRQACQQFEEIFLRMILKEAKLDRAFAREGDQANLYGDLFIETLAKSVAQDGGIGLSEVLYRQLSPSGDKPAEVPAPNAVKE